MPLFSGIIDIMMENLQISLLSVMENNTTVFPEYRRSVVN